MPDTPHPEAPSLPEPASIHLYTNRPSYSADQMRAVLAERDALRQELEALRQAEKLGPEIAVFDGDSTPLRPVEAQDHFPAREGLQPLTDDALKAIWKHAGRQAFGHPPTTRAIAFARMVLARGIGGDTPAGEKA